MAKTTNDGVNYVDYQNYRIQWGMAVSDVDGEQAFDFTPAFGTTCNLVVTTPAYGGVRSGFPVVRATNEKFTINRDNSIDGSVPFSYVAIGDAATVPPDPYGLSTDGGSLSWGTYMSKSDKSETFPLESPLTAGELMVGLATACAPGLQSSLPVTSVRCKSLTVARNSAIDGEVGLYALAASVRHAEETSERGSFNVGELLITLGMDQSTADSEQTFPFGVSYAKPPTVITTLATPCERWALSTSGVTTTEFKIDRDNTIDGIVAFQWIAFGFAAAK